MLEEQTAAGPPAEKAAIVLALGLTIGESANVAACIAAGLSVGGGRWAGRPLQDLDGLRSAASSHLPIVVLGAAPGQLERLVERLQDRATPEGAVAVLFPAYAKAIHDAVAYWAAHAAKSHRAEPLLGAGFAGQKKWVNSLVGSLALLR
jgi:hypothetical protein